MTRSDITLISALLSWFTTCWGFLKVAGTWESLLVGDNTALNGIRLHCIDPSKSSSGPYEDYATVQSDVGRWRAWTAYREHLMTELLPLLKIIKLIDWHQWFLNHPLNLFSPRKVLYYGKRFFRLFKCSSHYFYCSLKGYLGNQNWLIWHFCENPLYFKACRVLQIMSVQ